jgi:uncharacterized protein YdaU (DUF1376 family)
MAQAPVMPLWTDALIADTTHLSPREFGCYMLLLIATWRNNGQPFADDDKILARICRMPTYEWKSQIRKRLAPFFNLTDGSWRQKRLEKEWAFCSARGRTSKRNGAMDGRPSAPKPLGLNKGQNPAGSSQVNLDGTQKEPALTHTHKKSPNGDNAREARSSIQAEFAEFWMAYPHKVGKHAAELKFASARKLASQAELLDGIARYRRQKRDDAPWCNPATWLFGQRWLDQPEAELQLNGHEPGPPRPAINPRILGHSLPCSCPNCSRWVEQQQEARP